MQNKHTRLFQRKVEQNTEEGHLTKQENKFINEKD